MEEAIGILETGDLDQLASWGQGSKTIIQVELSEGYPEQRSPNAGNHVRHKVDKDGDSVE